MYYATVAVAAKAKAAAKAKGAAAADANKAAKSAAKQGRPPCPKKPLTVSQQRAIRSYRKQIAKHQKTLDAYRKNPGAFDNKGLLKDTPNDAVRQQIIDGRIRHLEGEIQTFGENIRKIGGSD